MSTVLSMDDVVKIVVNLSPRAALRNGFNLALILGTSEVISPDDRVKVYSSTESMIDDGFTREMPEYKAASLYFMQSTRPSKLVIGRWNETDAEKIGEAVAACRLKNRDWYICIPLDATSEQIKALAPYIEGVSPASMLCYTTQDMTLLEDMKKLNYKRVFGQYSMQSNAVVGIVGWAMGANTSLRNSAFTLAYKRLVGIEVDDFDENRIAEIQKNNGNYYINRGAQYDLFEHGTMAGGYWFDEIINLDMLVNDMQLSVMELLSTAKKIPQTEGGVNSIKLAMRDSLEKTVRIGFVTGGIWKGPDMMNLHYGDAIENGYLIQSEPVADQPQVDRENRIAPPIYIALKLAGAIHYVVIQVDVNR